MLNENKLSLALFFHGGLHYMVIDSDILWPRMGYWCDQVVDATQVLCTTILEGPQYRVLCTDTHGPVSPMSPLSCYTRLPLIDDIML